MMLSELCNVIAAREVVVFDARENHGIHSYGKDPLEEDPPIRRACLEFGERIVESVIATGLMEISITII